MFTPQQDQGDGWTVAYAIAALNRRLRDAGKARLAEERRANLARIAELDRQIAELDAQIAAAHQDIAEGQAES